VPAGNIFGLRNLFEHSWVVACVGMAGWAALGERHCFYRMCGDSSPSAP